MKNYSEAQIWSVIKSENHPSLSGKETTIAGYMPLVEELFPGINYYSITGFNQVMKDYVQPVLSKLFPDLVNKSAEEVKRDNLLAVDVFLPSKGYEHLDNPKWKVLLEERLK